MPTIFVIYILLLILYLFVFIFISYTIFAFISGAPFLPTSKRHVREMLEIANLNSEDTLMDLGSGDGRIVHLASKRCKKCIGIEINPTLYWWSIIKTKLKKLKNVEIFRQDLWKTDLSEIDVLTIFFIAPKMDKLHKKIISEMKPGSRVVSYGFKFPNWQYSAKNGKIYLYIV